MTCGIYKITNMINGKIYIGQSINVERRIKQHFTKKNHYALGRAFEKYGKDNFKTDIIAKCPDTCLDILEIVFIRELKCIVPNGYNLSAGGDAFMKGRKMSDEHKQKISNANKGKKRSEEICNNQSEMRKEYFKTERGQLAKDKISKSKIGKPSQLKGIKLNEERCQQISKQMLGRFPGSLNPAAISIVYEGIRYGCKMDLARHLGIGRKLLDYRISKGIIEVSK